jgi:predicted RNase H-like nuclease (RuvC/YqgF family)
MTSLAKYA